MTILILLLLLTVGVVSGYFLRNTKDAELREAQRRNAILETTLQEIFINPEAAQTYILTAYDRINQKELGDNK